MSDNQASNTHESQQHQEPRRLSEAQERVVRDWTKHELDSGIIVSKELIQWFAERLVRAHGVDDPGTIDPNFADGFLNRHEDLAKRSAALVERARSGGPTKSLNRLEEKMRKDRQIALFGDSPPPSRQPAPYPEGELIYTCNARHVVRHGSTVTKYTTSPIGLGVHDRPNEAMALQFVKAHTTIPVPAVVSSDWDRITMEYIEGHTLRQVWPVLTPDDRSVILEELRGYIAQMRALSGDWIGRLDGQGIMVPGIIPRSGGPFSTTTELHDWLVRPRQRLESPSMYRQSMYWHQITTQLRSQFSIVFTHGDIAARNIIVRDGHIVALLDWEWAGWGPEYWDYVFALRGLDNIDWETLGSHVPSLFDKRYDLEYILMNFITRLS